MKIFFIIILGLCSDIYADLVYPENGVELNYTHIPFEWEQESEAKYYQLQIATDISFNDIIYDIEDQSLIHILKEGIDWEHDYFWRVRGIKSDGVLSDWTDTYSFSIGSYDDIISLNTTVLDESSYYPGYNLFGSLIDKKTWIMDLEGEFIWYSDSLSINPLSDILPNGNMLAIYFTNDNILSYDEKRTIEYSIDKEIIWSSPDSLFAHHDMIVLPNGNYMMLIKEIQDGPIPLGSWTSLFQGLGYVADGVELEYPWEGDRIIEINPETYQIEWEWNVFDHYSLMDYDTLAGYWNSALDDLKYDWTHCNSLFFDEYDNSVYVSSRHLSRITKIDYDTGEVLWNLGRNMQSSDVDFGHDLCFSFQHDITILDNGNLLFLDNGNLSEYYCGTDTQITRALEVSISDSDDELSSEIEWEFVLPAQYSGTFMGSCRRLPNGNTLINPGAISDGFYGRSFEIDPEGEIVWEMSGSTIINRMYRISGLYQQKFSVIQPDFVWYLPNPTTYLSLGDNCLRYKITNEGHASQLYQYDFQDNGIWFDDQSGVVEVDAGETYELIFSGSVFYEIYPHNISLSVYPLESPQDEKNVAINAWSTQNNNSGCIDPIACNYNENAMTDDCSCVYNCLGDINLDNSIDIFDIIVIIEIILESVEPSDFQSFVADFDQSGIIDINDILAIVEFIL